ncbi:hypothetical protein IWQ60_008908 [Tieghemiomyces parasiticus]|uniref:Uncharacterized protein n=1 Tax=Tieghemiomyces parasiticus TaxID=78921 RepID=A0A9W7ZVR5_9FUNG|nr:hypothetical protein IWQ60_008908 [Tieghemiomyces parasiticus]
MFGGKRSTYVQFVIVAAIYFFASASFLVVNGIGGGGLKDPSIAASANFLAGIASLVVGLFAGAIHNYLGPRLSLLVGCLSYAFFAFSYLIYMWTGAGFVIIIAGVFFGMTITLFWTAQGSLMLSYPTEEHRGKYLTTFFVSFSASGIVGGALTLALNFNNAAPTLGDTTYWVSTIMALVGAGLVLILKPNSGLIRDDGSSVPDDKFDGFLSEVRGIAETCTNKYMLLMAPMFVFLGTYFTYIANGYNFSLFRMRTKGLNIIFFSVAGMMGSLAFGAFMKRIKLDTRKKGLLVAAIYTTLICASWISASFVQGPVTRESELNIYDFTDAYYWKIVIIYITWGFLDASLNAFSFWIMGYVTSDPKKLARYTAFTRCLQGVGGVISWGIDSNKVPFIIELWITFGFLLIAMASAFISILAIPFPTETDSMDSNSMDISFEGTDEKFDAKGTNEKPSFSV